MGAYIQTGDFNPYTEPGRAYDVMTDASAAARSAELPEHSDALLWCVSVAGGAARGDADDDDDEGPGRGSSMTSVTV